MKRSVVCIWIISDKKIGHENQSEGLVKGLSDFLNINKRTLLIEKSVPQFCLDILKQKKEGLGNLPDIVVGAGRRTHWPLIFCKFFFNSRSICLMKPSLPMKWFDLCIVPRHDGLSEGSNILMTEGPINLIEPSKQKEVGTGLILVGGESNHYYWERKSILSQIKSAIKSSENLNWTITDSRRTPKQFRLELGSLDLPNTNYVAFDAVKGSWLIEKLKCSQYVWITPDSVSMIYEALSAGARVGAFELRKKKGSRVTRNMGYLIKKGWITTSQNIDWKPAIFLDERSRISKLIANRWTNLGSLKNQDL